MKTLKLNSGVEINIDALTTTDRELLTAALAEKRGGYVPEIGEKCLLVNLIGEIFEWPWTNADAYDQAFLALGAVFHIDDREGAERYARCGAIAQTTARAAIKNWVEDNAEKVDWEDVDQPKWYRVWPHTEGRWNSVVTYYSQHSNLPHFASKADLEFCAVECAEHWDVLAEAMKEGM